MSVENILKEKQGTIVDVRTQIEFMGGNVPGSINIPLQDIRKRLTEIKNLRQPLIMCCASGVRSARATQLLLEQGVECSNGGSWLKVNYYQSQII